MMAERTREMMRKVIAFLEREFRCDFCLHGVIGQETRSALLPAMHLNRFCTAVKRRYPHYENICVSFDRLELQHRLRSDSRASLVKICPMGCREVVFPVRREGRLFGILFAGPFRPTAEGDILPGKCYDCGAVRPESERLPELPPERLDELTALGELLAACLADELAASAGALDDTAARITEFISRNLHHPCGIAELATELKLGRSRTSELLKIHFGVSFVGLLNQARIDAAKFMLEHTSYTQRQIAGRCGFRDPGYFHRVFRRRTGESPGDFRRTRRESWSDGKRQ